MASLVELQARTPAGARLVRCAESLATQFSARVAEYDRHATYPHNNVRVLKEAGYFVAPIPAQFGGQDVDSLHDVLVASTRLARGDPSTTLGLNMHLVIVLNMVQRWRLACRRGDARRAAAFGRSLERIVQDNVVLAAAVSEPHQDLTAQRCARREVGLAGASTAARFSARCRRPLPGLLCL